MVKETLETFISKSNNIHNNKYDYKNAFWQGVGVKVKIICTTHGEFEQTPSNHLMGKGCSYCSGVGRLTKEILLERIKQLESELEEKKPEKHEKPLEKIIPLRSKSIPEIKVKI